MKYHTYRRIQFCYYLLTFISICVMITFGIIAVVCGSVLYGCLTASAVVFASIGVKRSEEYQTKIDKYYE